MDIKKMLESEAEIREQLPKKIKVDNSTYTVRIIIETNVITTIIYCKIGKI